MARANAFTGSNFPWPEFSHEQRQLPILNFRMHAPDLLLNMPVGGQNVGITIEIVIEEEYTKSQIQQAGLLSPPPSAPGKPGAARCPLLATGGPAARRSPLPQHEVPTRAAPVSSNPHPEPAF